MRDSHSCGDSRPRLSIERSSTISSCRRALTRPNHNLLSHFHALPERHIPFNLLCRIFRLRIKPRRSRVPFSIHFHIVITRRALPRTHRMRLTRLEILPVNRIRRKILIPLHLDRRTAFSQHRAFPHCFCHSAHIDSYQLPQVHKFRRRDADGDQNSFQRTFDGWRS